MPRQVVGRITVDVELLERDTDKGTGSGVAQMAHQLVTDVIVASGTADGQMDRVYSDALSLTTTPTDLDLAGSLASDIGAGTVVFAEVSLIAVKHLGTTGNIQLGGDANFLAIFGAAADFILIPPGGTFLWYAPAGVAVTATTGDILQLAASTGTIAAQVVIGGRSA